MEPYSLELPASCSKDNAEERAEQNLATFSFVEVSQKEMRMELRASASESPMASRT